VVVFVESAFKHGYQEEDFFEVLETEPLKLRSRRGPKGVYELLDGILPGSICMLLTAAKETGTSCSIYVR
jgi:hypothetical protein